MKLILPLLSFMGIFLLHSCKKDTVITSADALLRLSEDSLHFDTVFTTTGSTTQYFKIFNPNNQKLILSNIQLSGGTNSAFQLNIDGLQGTQFSNVEIAAGDSIYGFVTVRINPNNQHMPFIIRDSIAISFNGNLQYLQLDAYGKNAYFLKNKIIEADTTWNNRLPIVIQGSLTINKGVSLTILPGTHIYINAVAPMINDGTIIASGESNDSSRIVFAGDRLDAPYVNYPGSWPGIYLRTSSKDNVFTYCTFKNGYQGIICTDPSINGNSKLTLEQCIFDNFYDAALGAINSSIEAQNCLISNCGYNTYISGGGKYLFQHCTFTSYANLYLDHKNPVFTISDVNGDGQVFATNCIINNSIIYAEGGLIDNELVAIKKGNANYKVEVNNCLYKNAKANSLISFSNSIANVNPRFASIDVGKRVFDFSLSGDSPCIGAGNNIYPTNGLDLTGKTRPSDKADIGCYQK